MSIPLYFAMPWEASGSCEANQKAQLGFCFHNDAALSVPEQIIPNCPIIINDANLPKQIPGQTTISNIIALSSCGCILDFERKPSDWSRSFIKDLELQLPETSLFAVPSAYYQFTKRAAAIIPTDKPVNSWTQFCRKIQAQYNKWMLEIIPQNKTVSQNIRSGKPQKVSDSVCFCRSENNVISYYDTFETVLSKLEIAEYYGCIAGIGLHYELENLKNK